MPLFCGHNLTDHFPPPHAVTLTKAGNYTAGNVDLTAGIGSPAAPKNPCCAVLIEAGAGAQTMVLVTYGGQTITITAAAAGSQFVRGSFTTISSTSTAASVTVFWQ